VRFFGNPRIYLVRGRNGRAEIQAANVAHVVDEIRVKTLKKSNEIEIGHYFSKNPIFKPPTQYFKTGSN